MPNVGTTGRLLLSRKYLLPSALIILLVAIVSFMFLSPKIFGAGGQLLINSFASEPSQALNVPFRSNTVTFSYTGGTVTFSSCSDQACTWAIDDAARLVVTRPDGSQVTRDFVSDSLDKPAENVTTMFQVGSNTVTTHMIDHFGPVRGLPRPLYLVESAGALPAPRPPVKQLPVSLKYTGHPFILHSKDPVNTLTGSFTYTHTDMDIKGRGPAPLFSRAYDSSDTLSGPFGPGWTHSYAMQLVRPDETTSDIVLLEPNGRTDRFAFSAGNYMPPAGMYSSLAKNSNGTYTVTQTNLTTWSFDETGRLLRIADRFGNQSTLGYDAGGRLVSVSDPAGRGSLAIGYDGAEHITSVTDWTNRVVRYGYDASGRLSTVTDRENQVTTFGYDTTNQRITTIKDARNTIAVTNSYDLQGRVATQKDARGLTTGQQTAFAYNTNADGTKTTVITYPKTSAEPTWSFVEEDTYDSQGRSIKKVSKPVSTSADWITEEYTYDANGNRASLKDGRGNTTKYCYDVDYTGAAIAGSRGNLTRLIAPAPTSGANQPVTLHAYDIKHNMLQTISPKGVAGGTTVSCSTNLAGSLNLAYATDFTYDAATQTQLISIASRYTEPGVPQKTALTKYEYGDAANPGLVTRLISPRGNISAAPDYSYATTNTYYGSGSKAGMLASVTTPAGALTTHDYDAIGRRIAMTDPRGNAAGGVPAEHTWQYSYDNEDRIRFSKAPAPVAGQALLVTETRYDAVGNKVVSIDANGQVTRNVYDERDSIQEVHQSPSAWTDPLVNPTGLIITNYQYDNLGNLTRVTRAKGNSAQERTTDYVFDGLNRLVREVQYPNWPTTTSTLVSAYTYDKHGNQASLKDPLNKTTTFAYDTLNRLTNTTYASTTTPNVTYSYDFNGNRTSMVDGTGTTSYAYDELDRMLSAQNPGPKTVGYRYDLDGNRVKVIYPDNTAVVYTFDKANRLVSLVDWSNRTTSYDYFIDGTPKNINQLNGTSAQYTYDNAGRLTQVWNKQGTDTITQHTYQMDAVGNRTHTDEVLTDGYDAAPITPDRQGTIDYAYDRLYRLTRENRQLPFPQDAEILDYTYDPVGNRLSETVTGDFTDRTDFIYDRTDRIKTADGDAEDGSYTVDANGNMTKREDGDVVFVYDQANRMIRADDGDLRYTYNGDGNRTKIQEGTAILTTTNTYVYDANRNLPVILQDMNRKYVWGLGLLYTVDGGNNPGVYHFDGLGSMRAITDVRTPNNPRVQMYEEYRAFGDEGYSNRLYNQPFKFTGEQKDENWDGDLLNLRSRYYDPLIGRFMTRDSAAGDTAQPQSLNRYSYVRNNPVNATDPSGMVDVWQVGVGGAQVAGGATQVVGGTTIMLATTLETLGFGAVVGSTLVGTGMYTGSAGIAMIAAGLQDQKLDPPAPTVAVASRFTSNEEMLNMAAITDFALFRKTPAKAYTWLKYANTIGDIGNLTDIYTGPLHDPRLVYAPKSNK